MTGLTPVQDKALRFIGSQALSPTFSEIAAHLGMKSKGSAHRVVDRLVERGFIRKLPSGRARTLEIISRVPTPADLARLSGDDLRTLADRVDAEIERRMG